METMKAIRMVGANLPLEMHEIPVPTAGPGEVLVRIRAAGICHSDAHYRAGRSPVRPLPLTLGHEIAGEVVEVGPGGSSFKPGDRVVLHYLLSCGSCEYCSAGNEQFCVEGSMLGHFADGGYAEYIAVPKRNALRLPDEIPFEQGAVLMCSSATSLHALRKARLKGGERVAVFGVGGLGISAVQLSRAFSAREVYAVDLDPAKLSLAERYGAIPVNAREVDPVEEIQRRTDGKGVDVALELIGLPITMRQAVRSLGIMGRAVIAGIGDRPLEIDTYRELLGKEAQVIGTNDHLRSELPLLIELARRGTLDLSQVVTRTVPLDAQAINRVLDEMEGNAPVGEPGGENGAGGNIRTVIVPG